MAHPDGSQAARAEYMARINRVIDHIDRRIGESLRLEDLARVANFSPFHFHRIFGAMVGETLNVWIQRRRAEKAAACLLAYPAMPITSIALDCGYSGSDAFARAFREHFGMSATEWRGEPGRQWRKNRQMDRKAGQAPSLDSGYDGGEIHAARSQFMDKSKYKVEVKEMPPLTVAYVRHIGPFQGVAMAFQKLMQWAGPRGLIRFPQTQMLAIYHDSPHITETDKLRSDACITVPLDTKVEGEIGKTDIPGGLFAVAHAEITQDEFGQAWDALMDWLAGSGYQPDDRSCYEMYLNDPKSHPEGKFIIDICEPIKPL
jgi:AraC family transcriptional regulator